MMGNLSHPKSLGSDRRDPGEDTWPDWHVRVSPLFWIKSEEDNSKEEASYFMTPWRKIPRFVTLDINPNIRKWRSGQETSLPVTSNFQTEERGVHATFVIPEFRSQFPKSPPADALHIVQTRGSCLQMSSVFHSMDQCPCCRKFEMRGPESLPMSFRRSSLKEMSPRRCPFCSWSMRYPSGSHLIFPVVCVLSHVSIVWVLYPTLVFSGCSIPEVFLLDGHVPW